MAFRNFTPHTLNLILPDGSELVFPSEGVARVSATPGKVSMVDGIPVAAPDTFGEVTGLPDEAGTDSDDYFIVSGMVGAALKGVTGILVPGTGPSDNPVRVDGRIVAVTRFKFV